MRASRRPAAEVQLRRTGERLAPRVEGEAGAVATAAVGAVGGAAAGLRVVAEGGEAVLPTLAAALRPRLPLLLPPLLASTTFLVARPSAASPATCSAGDSQRTAAGTVGAHEPLVATAEEEGLEAVGLVGAAWPVASAAAAEGGVQRRPGLEAPAAVS